MKPRSQAIFAALVLFGSGFVIGGGVGAWFSARLILRMLQSSPEETALADVALSHIHSDLSSELELDQPTRDALLRELQHSAVEVKRARAAGVDVMRRSLIEAADRVAAVLPPEKRDAFYKLSRSRFERAGFGAFFTPPVTPPPAKK